MIVLQKEDEDTAQSMNITPVQAIVHHHKSSSSCRREKHTERRNHSNEKERKSHQHECKDRRLYLGTTKAEELYLLILTKLKKAISEGIQNDIKKVGDISNQKTLQDLHY
ncbi:hypothetical protein X777_11575 [Ooceraea biroi]|uniref:Uncharacterized protein n=1 Tax=Ooceraea biroi TaxID=2015173 RepID=A0A026X061_OOCBI|nr:hypothetical protein X777_11575 [Ooceraea biroi]